jgi:hypothetical protein
MQGPTFMSVYFLCAYLPSLHFDLKIEAARESETSRL